MHQRIIFYGLAVLATASAAASKPPAIMSPVQAVESAIRAGPLGVRGTFAMLVRGAGHAHGHVFLNSEVDYRDPRNLSIDIDVRATKLLERQLGSPPDKFYNGKWIEVHGTARRVPILFFDDHGRSMGKYYLQTHVPVREPGQIAVIPPPSSP